ncbi:MAG: hypothetical protein CBCREVIR_0866, partial [Candidatus Burkholderia crenata]
LFNPTPPFSVGFAPPLTNIEATCVETRAYNDPTFLRARALSLSVGAIRKAQGKKCPGDFPVGTIEWHAVVEEFADDVLKAMLSEPDLPILEFKRDNARK